MIIIAVFVYYGFFLLLLLPCKTITYLLNAVYNWKFAQIFAEILKKKLPTYQSVNHKNTPPCDVNEGYSSHTKDEKIITCIPISKLLFTQSLSTL